MNKEQKRILLKKILPKAIILFLVVAGGISFLVIRNLNNKGTVRSNEFREKVGSQAIDIASGNYDSIVQDKLIIKFPIKYVITNKYGNEEVGGLIIFMNDFPKDELTLTYLPKENTDGLSSSINDVLYSLDKEIFKSLADKSNKVPTALPDKRKRIGDFDVIIREFQYDNNSFYIYAIESKKQYLLFTSHLEHFLKAIIENIKEIS